MTIDYATFNCNFSDVEAKLNNEVDYEDWKNSFMMAFTSNSKISKFSFDFCGFEIIVFLQDILFDDDMITYALTYREDKIDFEDLESMDWFLQQLNATLHNLANQYVDKINAIIKTLTCDGVVLESSINSEELENNITEITVKRYERKRRKLERAEKRAQKKKDAEMANE